MTTHNSRDSRGRFTGGWLKGLRPRTAPKPPVPADLPAQRQRVAVAAGGTVPVPDFEFLDVSPVEAPRLLAAFERALRAPASPMDAAALDIERQALERRFGAIDWNA